MRETQLSSDAHEVDVMYTNKAVFEGNISIRDSIFEWLDSNGRQGVDWGIIDRDPDDGFRGETFQFKDKGKAIMFKLTWGGK